MKNQTIKQVLKAIDLKLNQVQPSTMDDLINLTHSVDGVGSYGTSFKIVKYMGYVQGVRIDVTARKNTYTLPSSKKVYSVFNGLEKYIKAGYQIVND